MLASRLTFLCCWLVALAPWGVSASEHDSAAAAFRLGVEQFQSGDLDAARESFELAREGGLQSSSLLYNLGVVYYRQGQFDEAERTFRELLTTEHDVLARYNLGLVALARDDEYAAQQWFAQVTTPNTPDKLQALAQAQLDKLDGSRRETAVARTLRGYLSASSGYDSNIAGLPDTAASREGGVFGELLAAGSAPLSEFAAGEARIAGVAYGRHYPGNDEYDTTLLQGELNWAGTVGPMVRGASATLSQSWFDADALETRYGVEGFQRWSACGGLLQLARCSVALAFAQVSGGDGFEGYDGQWYQLRLSAIRRFRGWVLDGRYQWEVNNREDFRSGEQFVSVSPRHHTVEFTGRYRIQPDLTAGWVGAFRYSRYQDAYVLFENDGLVSEHRVDGRIEAGLFAEHSITERWLVRAEWEVQDNHSRIDRYDYQRHTFLVTLDAWL